MYVPHLAYNQWKRVTLFYKFYKKEICATCGHPHLQSYRFSPPYNYDNHLKIIATRRIWKLKTSNYSPLGSAIRMVKETEFLSFLVPLSLNSFPSYTLQSSTTAWFAVLTWLNDLGNGLCIGFRRFMISKNGSFKSSLADNLWFAGTKHFSMNSFTFGSLTFSREAGLIPCSSYKNFHNLDFISLTGNVNVSH